MPNNPLSVQEFEKRYPIGTTVAYHPVIGQQKFQATRIRSKPWTLGNGQIVVEVDDVSGGVSIAAIEPRDPTIPRLYKRRISDDTVVQLLEGGLTEIWNHLEEGSDAVGVSYEEIGPLVRALQDIQVKLWSLFTTIVCRCSIFFCAGA